MAVCKKAAPSSLVSAGRNITVLLIAQFWAMKTLLADPKCKAPWYNATGIGMYVSGMMIAAFALRSIGDMP